MTIRPSSFARLSTARPLHTPAAAGSADPEARSVALDTDSLLPAFEQLVAGTVAQVEACPPKADATFEGYEGLLAAIRSATTLEGMVLERGIALVAATNPDLTLVALERPLPVHETARAVFRRNDWAKASGLRLDSEVATREFYKPDLLIVDAALQLALVIDVKRSVASYKQRTLAELRSRMMASALVVRDVLERDHDTPPVARADIAIIDGAGDCRDEAKGIFVLADLDWMLRIDGAAAAITHLRHLYGSKVRAVLDQRCKAIIAPRLERQRIWGDGDARAADGRRAGGGAGDALSAAEAVTDETVRIPSDADDAGIAPEADGDADLDVMSDAEGWNAPLRSRHPDASSIAPAPSPRTRPRVVVGIASRRTH